MDEVCFQERIPHKVEQEIEARSTYVRTHAQTYVRTRTATSPRGSKAGAGKAGGGTEEGLRRDPPGIARETGGERPAVRGALAPQRRKGSERVAGYAGGTRQVPLVVRRGLHGSKEGVWLPFGPRLGRDAHREPAQHLHGGALRDIGGFCARRLAPIPSPPLPFSLIPFFLDIPPHHPQPHVRTYDIYERMSVVRPRSSCADRECVCLRTVDRVSSDSFGRAAALCRAAAQRAPRQGRDAHPENKRAWPLSIRRLGSHS